MVNYNDTINLNKKVGVKMLLKQNCLLAENDQSKV